MGYSNTSTDVTRACPYNLLQVCVIFSHWNSLHYHRNVARMVPFISSFQYEMETCWCGICVAVK